MIWPSARRRQAREFARAVDTGTRKAASELEAPLQVVTLLREIPPVEPDPAFVSELRSQLLAAAVSRSAEPDLAGDGDLPPIRGRTPRQQRGLAIAASTLVIVGAGTGTAAVSQQALPGDLLYPVKRSIENVQFHLARGDSGKGSQLLEQAATRLDEVEALTAEDPNPDDQQIAELNEALSDFSSETTDGGNRLIKAYASDRDTHAIGRIRVFTTQSATQLTHLAPAMPAELRTSFTQAATTVGSLDALAVRICATCGGALPLVSVPGQPLSAGPFLTDVSNVELSDLPSTGAGGSHPVTLPGGPPVTEVPTTLPTTSGTPTEGTTPSGGSTGGSTSEPTSPTSVQTSQTPGATVALPSAVLTPVTTMLPEDLPTIVITIPLPTLGLN
jgi:hypothetical protein